MTAQVLLSDLSNGSYITLGLAEVGSRPQSTSRYACSSQETFTEAVLSFLQENGNPPLEGAGFSTSGWDVAGHVDLVHFGFTISREELKALVGVQRVSIVNNFVARALSIPALKDHERIKIGGGEPRPEQVVAILGPNYGFGGALLAPDGMGRWTASHCEGGHSDFAPCNALEIEILKILMARYGHVSRERAVSIPGLVELWHCLEQIDGESGSTPAFEEILALAYAEDPRATQAIKVQTELFAGTASDYALIMGAKGGVYLSGDLLDMLGDLFDHDVFARRFYAKGRASSYIQDIPVFKVTAVETEVIGLGTLFG